jgi:hypothetical protein
LYYSVLVCLLIIIISPRNKLGEEKEKGNSQMDLLNCHSREKSVFSHSTLPVAKITQNQAVLSAMDWIFQAPMFSGCFALTDMLLKMLI